MAKWAMTKELYTKLLNMGDIHFDKVDGLSDKRVKFMEYIVNRRRQEILNLFKHYNSITVFAMHHFVSF